MPERPFLTNPEAFRDVSRGNPKPHTLKGDDLVKARLTPETWRLEIVGDKSATVEKPLTEAANTALDLAKLMELGKQHGVKFLHTMQCLNVAVPLGSGLWEGVPLRAVFRLLGKVSNVRRAYWWGFHNNDPKQLFQASSSWSQLLETPPGMLPACLVYRLNGQPVPLTRGGPVRLLAPWAHGFKSTKWVQRFTLTNDWRANDTYADGNNDPESYLKTMARISDGPETFRAGEAIVVRGLAVAGWSGLRRVEYWLRPDKGTHGKITDDDPAWQSAIWRPCQLEPPPQDWGGGLPDGALPKGILGFDPASGKPLEWPPRFSLPQWSVTLKGLELGAYEFRVRAVDLNGLAQPEPRPYPKSGRNEIQVKQIMVIR